MRCQGHLHSLACHAWSRAMMAQFWKLLWSVRKVVKTWKMFLSGRGHVLLKFLLDSLIPVCEGCFCIMEECCKHLSFSGEKTLSMTAALSVFNFLFSGMRIQLERFSCYFQNSFLEQMLSRVCWQTAKKKKNPRIVCATSLISITILTFLADVKNGHW